MFKLQMKKTSWIKYFKDEFGLIPSFDDDVYVVATNGNITIQAWQNADNEILTTIFQDNEAIKHYKYDYKTKLKTEVKND